jgi:hypothetical protein
LDVFSALNRGDAIEKPSQTANVVGIPPELEVVCMKALSHDPEKRFATALEFQVELERASKNASLLASRRESEAFLEHGFRGERELLRTAGRNSAQHNPSPSGIVPKLRATESLSGIAKISPQSEADFDSSDGLATSIQHFAHEEPQTSRGLIAFVKALSRHIQAWRN